MSRTELYLWLSSWLITILPGQSVPVCGPCNFLRWKPLLGWLNISVYSIFLKCDSDPTVLQTEISYAALGYFYRNKKARPQHAWYMLSAFDHTRVWPRNRVGLLISDSQWAQRTKREDCNVAHCWKKAEPDSYQTSGTFLELDCCILWTKYIYLKVKDKAF